MLSQKLTNLFYLANQGSYNIVTFYSSSHCYRFFKASGEGLQEFKANFGGGIQDQFIMYAENSFLVSDVW